MSAKRFLLTVGINRYKQSYYGSGNDLDGCVTDANNVFAACKGFSKRYNVKDNYATVQGVYRRISTISALAKDGDTVILHHSSHGTRVLDQNKDEKDGYDEALCFHDGIVLDDNYWNVFAMFKKGVNVIQLFDTCHSGTMYREVRHGKAKYIVNKNLKLVEVKGLTDVQEKINIVCNLTVVAACKDNQYASDLGKEFGGLFTSELLKAWDFKTDIEEAFNKIPDFGYQTAVLTKFK